MARDLRIPFEVAIREPELLKVRFEQLAFPQRVLLKSLYGIPLSSSSKDEEGWSELDWWAAQQGEAEYDPLGFLRHVKPLPYSPKEFEEAWAICGRRYGKTDAIASVIVSYEATMGGHEAYVRRGQPVICFQIAQDLRMAKYSLHLIKATLETSPAMMSQIKDVVADRIDLKNGLSIVTVPPTLKSVRGYANPVAVMDEVGVWYQDSDSANPDYEIYRAVKPAQAQFPHRKLVGISSPWNKAGLLFQYYEAGTDGRHAKTQTDRERFAGCLVVHAPSAASGNPHVTAPFLKVEAARDPRAFEREYLAEFQDSISGFLNAAMLGAAVDGGVVIRPPQPGLYYIAALDPAFRHDSFAFTICHADPKRGIVQDYIHRWRPEEGKPVDPGKVLAEISGVLKLYRIPNAYSDQYQLESLKFIANAMGFSIEGVDFTGSSKAEIYGSLQSLVNQQRIRLLDDADLIRELRQLEKRMLPGGGVQITAPVGMHDDLATVTALAAHKATWFLPPAKREREDDIPKEKTPFERMQEQIKRKATVTGSVWD